MMYLKPLVIFLLLFFSILSHGSDGDSNFTSSSQSPWLNDFTKLVELADRALLYGDVEAMKIMGAKLEQAGHAAESFKYYLKATKKGDKEARLKLQSLYDQGIGTQSERIEAAFYLAVQKCIARIFRSKE